MSGEPPPRSRIRAVFLRILGLVYLIAFLSLLAQVDVLFGSRGLLPVQQYLEAIGPNTSFLQAPTLFWIGGSDTALHVAAIAGALLSCGLIHHLGRAACHRGVLAARTARLFAATERRDGALVHSR